MFRPRIRQSLTVQFIKEKVRNTPLPNTITLEIRLQLVNLRGTCTVYSTEKASFAFKVL